MMMNINKNIPKEFVDKATEIWNAKNKYSLEKYIEFMWHERLKQNIFNEIFNIDRNNGEWKKAWFELTGEQIE